MATPPIRAAYWDSPDPPCSLNTSLFNYVYYASVQPYPETFKLTPITPDDNSKFWKFIECLHHLTPRVKTLLSVGSTDNHKQVFSNMASTEQNREAFISSTIEVARTYGFDGVDLDWEFPENQGDMSNLGLLYEQWRNALEQDATDSGKPRLLLTSAVYYAVEVYIDGPMRSYPAVAIQDYVDWVNVMCYDYQGPWDKFTGERAALYDPHSNRNADYGITSWIAAGVKPNKLVMGLPLHGWRWNLKDPENNGIGAPAEGMRKKTYKEIVEWNKKNNAKVTFDYSTASCYSSWDILWNGYDDVCSVDAKVQYAKPLGLAGYFFWALGIDTEDWTLPRRAFGAWN